MKQKLLYLFFKSKSVKFHWFQRYTCNYVNQWYALSFSDNTLILISESTPLLIKIAEKQ